MAHHVVVLAVYFPGRFFTAALPLSLGIAIGGMFWCWLYERTGSIIATWVSHFLIDGAIMIVGYDLAFVASH
jgi:membrane protease YdiL (CAAX protease family)